MSSASLYIFNVCDRCRITTSVYKYILAGGFGSLIKFKPVDKKLRPRYEPFRRKRYQNWKILSRRMYKLDADLYLKHNINTIYIYDDPYHDRDRQVGTNAICTVNAQCNHYSKTSLHT